MEFAIIWLGFGIASAIVANNKGRSGCGFLSSRVLSRPYRLILALVVSPDQTAKEKKILDSNQGRRCPFCAEVVRREAIKCRFCGERLPNRKLWNLIRIKSNQIIQPRLLPVKNFPRICLYLRNRSIRSPQNPPGQTLIRNGGIPRNNDGRKDDPNSSPRGIIPQAELRGGGGIPPRLRSNGIW